MAVPGRYNHAGKRGSEVVQTYNATGGNDAQGCANSRAHR